MDENIYHHDLEPHPDPHHHDPHPSPNSDIHVRLDRLIALVEAVVKKNWPSIMVELDGQKQEEPPH